MGKGSLLGVGVKLGNGQVVYVQPSEVKTEGDVQAVRAREAKAAEALKGDRDSLWAGNGPQVYTYAGS
jgi:hypothetical protein